MSIDSPKSAANLDELANPGPPNVDASAPEKDSEDLRERARDVQERIEEGFHEMEARYDDARTQMRTLNDQAVHFIRENPALSIAGAVGVGYIVGKLAARRWLA